MQGQPSHLETDVETSYMIFMIGPVLSQNARVGGASLGNHNSGVLETWWKWKTAHTTGSMQERLRANPAHGDAVVILGWVDESYRILVGGCGVVGDAKGGDDG